MPYRIIVADKDPVSRETLSRFFEASDYQLLGVRSATELKQQIKTLKPDLVILNSILEDTPGWHAVRKIVSGIKTSRNYSDVPVLLILGDPGSPSATELQESGADGYLRKPLDEKAVRSSVESFLEIPSKDQDDNHDDDIMIDFDDDDSEDSGTDSEALTDAIKQAGEPAVDLEHRSDIEPVSLVEEPGHRGVTHPDDFYGNEFDLNLEDIGVPDELDAVISPYSSSGPVSSIPINELERRVQDLPDLDVETVPVVYDLDMIVPDDKKPQVLTQQRVPNEDTLKGPSDSNSMKLSLSEDHTREIFVDTHQALPPYTKDFVDDFSRIISGTLPSRDEILSRIDQSIVTLMPSKEEVSSALKAAIAGTVENLFSEPEREEVMALLREEIEHKLLDTVEKVIREQIEKITSDIST
jgi:CheY-like chemotaxis protein